MMTLRERINGIGKFAALTGGGALAGGFIACLYSHSCAERMFSMAERFGGYFVIAMMLLYLGDRMVDRVGSLAAAGAQQATAMQTLAAAVREVAGQDAPRLEGIEGSLGMLHRKVDRLLRASGNET